MTGGRADLLETAVRPRRLVGAGREHASYEQFCAHHGLAPSPQAVTLYLTHLWDSGTVHGRGLRYRLQLLDLHARLAGEPVPSQDSEVRRYLRGLHRQASLASPEKGVEPLHTEALHAVLEAIARPTRQQHRDAALLVFANASGLPASVLASLPWDHVRFHEGILEVNVPAMPGRGPRPYSPLRLPAPGGTGCPGDALLAWRTEAGPAQQPVFSLDGRSCDLSKMRPVLRLLGPAPGPADIARRRIRPSRLAAMLHKVLAPQPRQVRDRALLLLAWSAALGTHDASTLLQGDVQVAERGLLVRISGRTHTWTGVFATRNGAPCPAAAWRDWRAVLKARGLADDRLPAFTQITGAVVKAQPLAEQGLNLLVRQDCEAAALRGHYAFTSLRTGFIRTAIRSGTPEHVIGRHAGLSALASVSLHARRELLLRCNVATLVGL